ncbi:hypothetical protein [Myxococcus landrumensis]|uniref:Lipoprotein n=1 Tax=Myxococcus landrumensis TaxID=2813577 RepID=A0ABX7N5Z7_9BACT|nr:hypothetical protein [Myxococcus landrumus]QSQ13102.1 hypothetical protein JY572_32885 [Myxococcus landrumus]
MQRAMLFLAVLMGACAKNVPPPEPAATASSAPSPESRPEPETPKFEHIYMMPVEQALAEATRLLAQNGWVLKPLEDPKYLLTEWRAAQIGTQSWGWQSDGDFTRYLVAGELLAARKSIVRIFRMKRVSFSNDAEIKALAGGVLGSDSMRMEFFEQSFRRMGAPTDLAQRERDTAPWVELDGAIQGTRDLKLEQDLLLRLETRPSLEALTGTLRLTRDDTFARDPSFYLKRWRQEVQEPCDRKVAGFQPLLQPGLTVLIGEQLGTRESPAAVGDLACEAAKAGHGVTLVLSLPDKEQKRLDAYLKSPGRPGDQDALLHGDFWRKLQQDGRGSRAMMDLIDRARALNAAGHSVAVVAMDTDMSGGKARDAHMAQVVLKHRAARPQDVLLLLAGNVHTRLGDADWDDDFVPLSKHLHERFPNLKVLEVGYAQGRRWGCDVETSGDMICDLMGITPLPELAIPPEAPVALRMLPKLHDEGFHGFLDVGTLSVSLPAIALRGHEPPAPSLMSDAADETAPATPPAPAMRSSPP